MIDVVVGASSSLGVHYLRNIPWNRESILATYLSEVPLNGLDQTSVTWRRCDVTARGDLDHLIDHILTSAAPVRLVWFAGVLSKDPGSPIEWEELNHLFQVNSLAVTYLVSNILENLLEGSRICICSSVAAINGSYDVAYAASKSAINGLVLSGGLRCENDVSVFAVLPNTVEDSSMFNSFSLELQDRHRRRTARGLLRLEEVSAEIYKHMLAPSNETKGRIFPIGVQ